MRKIDEKPYYSPRELAAILDTTEIQVRQGLRDGRIQGIRQGRTWQIPHTELERILKVLTP